MIRTCARTTLFSGMGVGHALDAGWSLAISGSCDLLDLDDLHGRLAGQRVAEDVLDARCQHVRCHSRTSERVR